MKVLALNGSPLKARGNTDIILKEFLAGLKETGAEIEEVYISDLNIKPCIGKLVCWIKTPGVCCQDDDMRSVLEKLKTSDVWVFGTPVYWDGATGPMKNLMDRMLPLIKPFIELVDGHHRHALNNDVMHGKIVLVSSCGFWEKDNFEPIIAHFQAASKNIHREFAGALVRPHGALVKYMVKQENEIMNDVLAAARRAGEELGVSGEISQETLERVSQEMVSRDKYMEMINNNFERLREKSEKGLTQASKVAEKLRKKPKAGWDSTKVIREWREER